MRDYEISLAAIQHDRDKIRYTKIMKREREEAAAAGGSTTDERSAKRMREERYVLKTLRVCSLFVRLSSAPSSALFVSFSLALAHPPNRKYLQTVDGERGSGGVLLDVLSLYT